jgi:hypothetical protein
MSDEVKISEPVRSGDMNIGILFCLITGLIGILIGLRVANKGSSLLVGIVIGVLALLLFAFGLYLFFARNKQFEFTAAPGGKFKVSVYSANTELVVNPVERVAFFYWKRRDPGLSMVKIYAVFYNESHKPVFGIFSSAPWIIAEPQKEGFEQHYPQFPEETEDLDRLKMFDGPVKRVFELYEEYR